MSERYGYSNLWAERRDSLRAIGHHAGEIERILSEMTGEQLAAFGDRVADPMQTLLEMRSVAIILGQHADAMGPEKGPES